MRYSDEKYKHSSIHQVTIKKEINCSSTGIQIQNNNLWHLDSVDFLSQCSFNSKKLNQCIYIHTVKIQ